MYVPTLILTAAGSFTLGTLYMAWIETETRKEPANRSSIGRALIRTWETIRTGVEWAFNKAGLTTRT